MSKRTEFAVMFFCGWAFVVALFIFAGLVRA